MLLKYLFLEAVEGTFPFTLTANISSFIIYSTNIDLAGEIMNLTWKHWHPTTHCFCRGWKNWQPAWLTCGQHWWISTSPHVSFKFWSNWTLLPISLTRWQALPLNNVSQRLITVIWRELFVLTPHLSVWQSKLSSQSWASGCLRVSKWIVCPCITLIAFYLWYAKNSLLQGLFVFFRLSS